ncbi:MAG: hypothetical protein JRM85_00045 [Nitrososphaerota archaeon]|nr:hypothetical protein [Nitrososphaerota archaeon]MDG6918207.1 hypothetical protein [Nitrososphaerota archaeon]
MRASRGADWRKRFPKVGMMMRDVGLDASNAMSKRLTEEKVRRAGPMVYLAGTGHAPSYLEKCRTLSHYRVQNPVSMTHA